MIRIAEDPNSDVTQKDMYNALVSMIKWARQFKQREEIIQLSNGMISPLMWAKELCTVKFCLPRQSGHTTFIKEMLGAFGPDGANSELFENPAIIFPNNNVAQNCGFSPGWTWVGTPTSALMDGFRGRRWGGVIIDCTSILSNKEIEKIYDGFKAEAASNPNFIFVFLE